MGAKWKKNKNLKPQVILNKIDDLKKIEDGNVTFSSFEFNDAKAALESMIDFPDAAQDLNKSRLVSDAVWKVARNPRSEASTFIEQVNSNIRGELAKRDNRVLRSYIYIDF